MQVGKSGGRGEGDNKGLESQKEMGRVLQGETSGSESFFSDKNPLHEGKGKRVFHAQWSDLGACPEPRGPGEKILRLEFKDDLTALNGKKKGSFLGKGELNRDISSLLFRRLREEDGISSHWIQDEGKKSMYVRAVEMIPLEVVVRNRLAGSTARRLGFSEGHPIQDPLVEFYYKKDELDDPFVSTDQVLMLGLCTHRELQLIHQKALWVNQGLKRIFKEAQLDLIDFKIEFGRQEQTLEIVLADEISPDSCRLWDFTTGERLDKDRFRRDWGGVEEGYREIWKRLEGTLKKTAKTLAPNELIFEVKVLPRDVILDTQGRAVEQSLHLNELPISFCRVGKYMHIGVSQREPLPFALVNRVAQDFLHNPLIEKYEVELQSPRG